MKIEVLVFLLFGFLQHVSCLEPELEEQVATLKKQMANMERNFQGMSIAMKKILEVLPEKGVALDERVTTIEEKFADFSVKTEDTKLNATIEERVTLLELQVAEVTDDLEELDDEVILLTSEQLIQAQRLLDLDIETDQLEESIEGLVATDIFVALELDTVNATLINHEDRLQRQELEGVVAFQAEIGEYASIPEASVVIYNQVLLNLGNGFNIETGELTVPPGGAGLYYFHISFLTDFQEYVDFYIRANAVKICRAFADVNTSGVNDRGSTSCGAAVQLNEGDIVDVYYGAGTDDTPVNSSNAFNNNFTGLRIAPQ